MDAFFNDKVADVSLGLVNIHFNNSNNFNDFNYLGLIANTDRLWQTKLTPALTLPLFFSAD